MRLEIASRKAIEYACKNFHYSKSVPANPIGFSVFENDHFISCVIYSQGANVHIGTPYGLSNGQCIELTRMALNGKQNSTSAILARSIKIIKHKLPLCKMLVSYADIDQNHFGTIYQATNWYYVGKMNEGARQGFLINGRKRHNKSVHSMGYKQNIDVVRKYLDPNAIEIKTKGKYKYLYPLTIDMKELCEKIKKPYPKKSVKNIESDVTPFQEDEGGATPTLTHQ